MLDPRVKGYTLSRVSNPAPTSGVKVDVNTEEDWTKNVTNAPKIIIKYLYENNYYIEKEAPTKLAFRQTYPVSHGK